MLSSFIFFIGYLFYGLTFFTIGVAISSKDISISKLRNAKYLWYIACFAYIHALHEWLTLYLKISTAPVSAFSTLVIIKLFLAAISFIFLFFFGLQLLATAYPGKKKWLYSILVFALLFCMIIVFDKKMGAGNQLINNVDWTVRVFLGFPGGIFAGLGLISYARTVQNISTKGARSFAGAGYAMFAYGLFAGVWSSEVNFFSYIPIEVLRGIAALGVLHFIMNALHVFDIEQMQETEERLQRFAQTEKLSSIGKMAAGIAHEINNPLSNALINVERIKQKPEQAAGEEGARRLEAIERNIEKASRTARELLHFSHGGANHFVRTDLNRIIRDTLALLGCRRDDYTFELDLYPLMSIKAIPGKLEEVLLNVLINAMDASEKGSRIIISSRKADNSAVVEITDFGSGISAENIDRIFDPFFTTKEIGQGTGLGLSISYGIIEMHGGEISVKSEKDTGTTVTLRLPDSGTSGEENEQNTDS